MPTFDDVTATLMGVRDCGSLIIGIIVGIDALHSMMVTATLMGVRDCGSLIIGIIVGIDALHSMMSPRP